MLLLQDRVKRLPGVRWSQTHRCWYLPLQRDSYDCLKPYLAQRSAALTTTKSPLLGKARAELLLLRPLSPENIAAFTAYQSAIKLRGYSPNTLRTYSGAFDQLLRLLGAVPVSSLTKAHFKATCCGCWRSGRLAKRWCIPR